MGGAPSIRPRAIRCPPSSTMATVTLTPRETALECALAMSSVASLRLNGMAYSLVSHGASGEGRYRHRWRHRHRPSRLLAPRQGRREGSGGELLTLGRGCLGDGGGACFAR